MKPEDSKRLLAYTPMLHARLFAEGSRYRDHSFQATRKGLESMPAPDHVPKDTDIFLDGRKDIDRPLTVQFCANDPDFFLEAAKYVQPYCDAVDLNLGCPQGIARKGRYGAFLQEDWDLIYRLINKLHTGLAVPVTAKFRIQETKEKTLEYARHILSAGASILTVHGRQREQKGHKTGLADWAVIRYLRDNLPPETVIFANGNILRHEDIARCLEYTGADGVMSAEGNLHDPTIFAPPPAEPDDRIYWRGRNGKGAYRVDAVFRRYMNIIYKYVLERPEPERRPLFVPVDPIPQEAEKDEKVDPETEEPPAKRQKQGKKKAQLKKSSSPNLTAMQSHLFSLLRPLVSVHTEVRDVLARSRAGDMQSFENVLRLTECAVRDGLIDYEANPAKYDDEMTSIEEDSALGDIADFDSSLKAVKACKRPWWCCQAYVRPVPKEALEKGSLTLSRKEREEIERKARDKDQEPKEEGKGGMSERERRDVEDGMDQKEMPRQAVVAG